ncbi:MAG: sugar phosphate isomerase/epimerase [Deltaproteobacteria bacterium]|nr:sugar phosphate isomerase/epimerase [Deltaproteobacteria bacterium]MBW1719058.1 sugar phosphate isomerase/epimerase [Deltaproteobacteria bacterium]MBW1938126.1 sugar phosphate isomerase/epimerase [Deltaproteobacteria bacterium]MBW1964578.1 sugar phosphate isomerase/epimerase [Deltaproteobacteria bacterium]MBW2350013.1 sugar phosphate isomerase/epimerase [Deltaproteobacteria bacterium]
MDIERLKQQAFVCCPFDLLVNKYLPTLLKEHINPEIGLNGEILDQFQRPKFKKVAKILKKEGLICTIHAPYSDLSLGAIDQKVRRISVERIKKALDLASLFEAKSVVCHTGFDYRHYYNSEDRWIKNAIESMTILVEYASTLNIPLMLENVYELDTDIHKEIFRGIRSPLLGFCLDFGHQNVFSKTSLDKWLKDLGDRLGQLHLHDNMGVRDDHLAIGEGILDFDSLFSWLYAQGKIPILTLEPHEEAAVIPALKGLAGLLDNYPIIPDYA